MSSSRSGSRATLTDRLTRSAPTAKSACASSMPWRTRTQASGARRSIMCNTALDSLRTKADGSPASPATVNASIAAVKALLGFAHTSASPSFNAAPLIKLRAVPGQPAKRILPVVDVHLFLRAARPGHGISHLPEVAYFGALRISEIACSPGPGHPARDRRSPACHRRQRR